MPGAAPYPGAAPLRPPRFNPSPAGPGRPVKPRGGGHAAGGAHTHAGRAHPRGTKGGSAGTRGGAEGGQCPLRVRDTGGAPLGTRGLASGRGESAGGGGARRRSLSRIWGLAAGVLGRSEGTSRARDTGAQPGGGAREVASLRPHGHAGPGRCPRCRSGRCPRCQPGCWVAPAPPGCPVCVCPPHSLPPSLPAWGASGPTGGEGHAWPCQAAAAQSGTRRVCGAVSGAAPGERNITSWRDRRWRGAVGVAGGTGLTQGLPSAHCPPPLIGRPPP